MVEVGELLARRGYAHGTSGNLSVRATNGVFITPTNTSLGELEAERISHVNLSGDREDGDPPSKEVPLHLAVYRARPAAAAVVHLHSTNAVAVSCLAGMQASDVFPPLTPYSRMRLGSVRLIPYHRPGDPAVATAIADAAREHHVLLLANHGSVVAAATLREAFHISEELEETSKLFLLLRHEKRNDLTPAALEDLDRHFPRS